MSIPYRDSETGRIMKQYTQEQEEFLKDVYVELGLRKTTNLFNERFNCNKTESQIESKMRRLGVKRHEMRYWADEEIRYLEEVCVGRPIDETVELMRQKFGIPYTKGAVKSQMKSKGLRSGHKYCFTKGHRNVRRSSVGTISFSKFAGKKRMLFIKVSDTFSEQRGINKENWKPYKNYVWEQHYGEIPDTHFVVCADGNEQNCDISNLRLIPWKYVQNLTRWNKWYGKGKEILDAGIAWCDLNEELKKMGCKYEGEEEE